MKKTINPCEVAGYASVSVPVFCEIEFSKDGRLSVTGVIGPMWNGNARGGCGQIDSTLRETIPEEITFTEGWNAEIFEKFLSVWERWHLNDMRPGCEHQREWNTGKEIVLQKYTWSGKFHATRKEAEAGTLAVLDYSAWKEISARVMRVTINSDSPKWESPMVKELTEAGWIKPEKSETKTAGWVTEAEHPEGLLCKPCPTCGYEYGSAWKREEVPADVLAFLESLPGSAITPAWV